MSSKVNSRTDERRRMFLTFIRYSKFYLNKDFAHLWVARCIELRNRSPPILDHQQSLETSSPPQDSSPGAKNAVHFFDLLFEHAYRRYPLLLGTPIRSTSRTHPPARPLGPVLIAVQAYAELMRPSIFVTGRGGLMKYAEEETRRPGGV